jgi:hypothetical protein
VSTLRLKALIIAGGFCCGDIRYSMGLPGTLGGGGVPPPYRRVAGKGASMATPLGDLLDDARRRTFVGRRRELPSRRELLAAIGGSY